MLPRKLRQWKIKRNFRKRKMKSPDDIGEKYREMSKLLLDAERKSTNMAKYYRGFVEGLKWILKEQ